MNAERRRSEQQLAAIKAGAMALHLYERDNYRIREPDEEWGDLDADEQDGYMEAATAVLNASPRRG